jgi:hypothetical protein
MYQRRHAMLCLGLWGLLIAHCLVMACGTQIGTIGAATITTSNDGTATTSDDTTEDATDSEETAGSGGTTSTDNTIETPTVTSSSSKGFFTTSGVITDFAIDAKILASFAATIDISTVSTSTFYVVQTASTKITTYQVADAIAASVSCTTDGLTCILTPAANLSYNTAYIAVLASGIKYKETEKYAFAELSQRFATVEETTSTPTPTPVATKLVFTTAPSNIAAGSCSTVLTVQRQDAESAAVTSGATTVSLSENTGNATLYSDAACTSAITTVTIAESSSTASAYMKYSAAGTLTVTAAKTGLTSDTTAVTFAIDPSKLVFSAGPTAATGGSCSSLFTVQRQNANDIAATSGALSVTLSDGAGSATFYSDVGCSTSTTTATIADGASTTTFYLQDATIEALTISAAATDLTTATRAVTVYQSVDDFVTAVKAAIGPEYLSGVTPSNAFVEPSSANRATFKGLVTSILNGTLTGHDANLTTLGYQLVYLSDDTIGSKTVVALQETGAGGGGTYLFYLTASNEFIFEVPHPIADANTLEESSYLFLQLKGRGLFISGTHRCANDAASDGSTGLSTCSGVTTVCNDSGGNPSRAYPISDVAHYENNYFHEAHKAAHDQSATNIMFSMHGMALAADRPSVSISNGENDTNLFSKSISMVNDLTTNLAALDSNNPAVPDAPDSCNDGDANSLCGTTNVQGRYTNGGTCTSAASTGAERFFHIEQIPEIRNDTIPDTDEDADAHWTTIKNAIDAIF